jgi:predicted acylesterase/phospholipase RssA
VTRPNSVDIATGRWWQDANLIDYCVSGVFEGGGAKGVLYAGALEGMVDERCWFDAVAGASAGAITATLVAAGMRPDQIKKRMNKALATLRLPTPLNGAFRVRDGASLLNQDALLSWLRHTLEASFRLLDGTRDGAGATFERLYELTGIELHVVAVDINRHQLVVFNHELTPTCQVTEAVVASAAIPFAFEGLWLNVPGRRWGMIVDGGIAANFPTFVFTDRSFRAWAGLRDLPDTAPIVGFLLDEADSSTDEPRRVYKKAVFEPELGASRNRKFRAAKVTDTYRGAAEESARSGVTRLAKIVLFPLKMLLWPLIQFFFNWFPRFLAVNGRGRTLTLAVTPSWLTGDVPTRPADGDREVSMDRTEPETLHSPPRAAIASRAARGFARWFDRIMIGSHPPGVFVFALAVVSLFLGAGLYHYGWQPLVNLFYDAVSGNGKVSILGTIIGIIVLLAVISTAVYAWIVLVAVFLTASFTHATTRTIGYGLAKTFLQGAGAPPWAGHHPDDHVIRLAVPPTLTTLNASLPSELIASALAAAQDQTRSTMRAIHADAHRTRAVTSGDESSRITKAP